ncbi:MAG: hypothetical protein IPH44_25670 [Myxococcales bacterium]|nr:hypothetical protein [Myxococcales bacterium]MBK7191790.1 hypothetical protein [Myxococcales bacterium]MBP6848805.1 hypothetical protein [Kofleriaceae bacterium]
MRSFALAASLIACSAAGCGSRSDARATVSNGGDGGAAGRPPVVADAGSPDASTEVARHMAEHLTRVSRMQEALVRGQLEIARDEARWLVAHPEHVGVADAGAAVARLRGAAEAVVAAPDLPAMAGATARLGAACAACHEERGVMVAYAWAALPDDEPALARQMQRHQWAAARLWEGVVGPADELWRTGASTLATLRLDVGSLAAGADAEAVKAALARVRSMATQAGAVKDQASRVALYGELLTTCVGCHAAVRPAARPMP